MENTCSLEEPLRGTSHRTQVDRKKPNIFQGPKRAVRLCLLGVILPGLLIAVPLYLKHRVYDYQIYPIGMSDMRLIDNKVSTTWCQKQLVKANATFNAFLMPDSPHVANDRLHVSMTRHLLLSDDMKEYWGFYLLKGSTVTVSTCVRWPGASLILIRGHRHLHECAYIGDDSSEEIEELMEIAAEKGLIHIPDISDDGPPNRVDLLTKYRPEVTFHDPTHRKNAEQYKFAPSLYKDKDNEDESSAKKMKELLDLLSYKADRVKANVNNGKIKPYQTQSNNTNIDKIKAGLENGESKNLKNSENKINASSYEELQSLLEKFKRLGSKRDMVLDLFRKQLLDEKQNQTANDNSSVLNKQVQLNVKEHDGYSKKNGSLNSSKPASSNESFEEKLHRLKRELIIKTVLGSELNADADEKENLAIEEGYVPDGIADHHHVLNQTTMNDRSNSEFWSSFSSSEEALLNCAGLILSLPLNPHRFCESHRDASDINKASLANTITYSVPTNGYYFFVFNSENEVQQNFIRVHFNLEKTIYNVTNSVSKCSNTTEQCVLPLDFFSNEKVVFEFPVENNESLWNEEFMVISECEPRTIVYLICVLSAPLIILLFAFQ